MKQASVDREMTMELIVGTFAFMILLALGYFTIVLGRVSLFEKKFPMEVEFQDVMGLRKDDNVVLRGMTVGKIKTLRLVDGKVRVLAMIDNPVELRTDYKIVIVTTSILGGRYMEIKEGTSDAPFLSSEIMPQGDKPFDLMAEAAATIHDIRHSLNEGGVLTNLESSIAAIKDVTGKINRGEGSLGKLVNDDALYTDVHGAMKEIRGVVANLQTITDKIGKGEGTLGKLIADDSLYTNIQAVAVNLREISDRINQGEGTLGKLIGDDAVYTNLQAVTVNLKAITDKIERGEGLVGKLVNDESLYNDIKAAVGEVRRAVDDFRETSPVVSFTQLLFGAF
jgi:phospholipid/cholesterol/gamma-HCH transport system substrate-binding protein